MWAIVYMCHSQSDAESAKRTLEKEGLLVKIRKVGKEEDKAYEILVPKEEIEDAHEVLSETVY
ncbi:MAG: glutamate decarboxylase [Clostridiales bacterium]|nr:glutamate decarboxylase [Clostridiales bacterium]